MVQRTLFLWQSKNEKFIQRTEADEFDSQPGGVDLKRQGTLLLSGNLENIFLMCSQITAWVVALLSRLKLCCFGDYLF